MNKPFLDGVRVIALTWVWAGPWMGAVLADMGAEVIKIESNRRLDTSRVLPPFAGGKPGPNRSVANIVNRGVKSCSIDLGQPKGVALLKDLIKVSDVVIENFSPRVMANLGLDYSVLKTVKSDIVENGVAQVSAQAGLEVALRGIDDELLQGGFGSIIKSLDMVE